MNTEKATGKNREELMESYLHWYDCTYNNGGAVDSADSIVQDDFKRFLGLEKEPEDFSSYFISLEKESGNDPSPKYIERPSVVAKGAIIIKFSDEEFEKSSSIRNGNLYIGDFHFDRAERAFLKEYKTSCFKRCIVQVKSYGDFEGMMNLSDKEVFIKDGYTVFGGSCDNIIVPPKSVIIKTLKGDGYSFSKFKILPLEAGIITEKEE